MTDFERKVNELAQRYAKDSDLAVKDGASYCYVLPIAMQPGVDMKRMEAYKLAVKAGFYNG